MGALLLSILRLHSTLRPATTIKPTGGTMESATALLFVCSPATTERATDAEFGLAGATVGSDPHVGLALMAIGLIGYAGCLCIRDRWWEW